MQLRGLLLGLVLSAEGINALRFHAADRAGLVRRQADTSSGDSSGDSSSDSTSAGSDDASTTVLDVITSSTAAAEPTSDSSSDSGSSPTDDSGSSGTTTSADAADTTITRTVTVTNDDADTVTRTTTINRTSVKTVVVTSTVFETATVTSDGETATSVVYVTSTVWANQKRDLSPRTIYNDLPYVDAKATDVPPARPYDEEERQLLRPRDLQKRATITRTVTVTAAGDDASTVTDSVTRTVISTTTSAKKTTKTVTETEQANASTTITTTSTLTVTSTSVTTGVATETGTAEGSASSGGASSDGGSSGLSTGAKAGIGAGAGVVGLIALGAIFWCLFKRRNKPSKSELDDMFGSSEVPVGPGPARDTSARLSSNRMSQISPTIPNVSPVKSPAPEGYRGTAMGDGRAGYAKPKPFGAAYAPVSPETAYSRTLTATSGGDDRLPSHPSPPPNAVELGNDGTGAKWHQAEAAEIDGNQVSSARGSSPPEHVYEMPAQPYR